MTKKDQQLQEKFGEMKFLEEKIQQLQQQAKMVEQQIEEVMMATYSVEEFKKVKEKDEVLVPIATGLFARAIVKEHKELLVNVGASTVVVKDANGAQKILQQQMQELTEVQQKVAQQMQKLGTMAQGIEKELQTLTAK